MRRTTKTEHRWAFLVAALVLLLVAAVAGVAAGARSIAPAEVWRALFAYAGTDDHLIVREMRIPRTIAGVLIGAALGVAGALIQTLTRNPLAEPGLLGVTAGAGFAINIGVLLGIASTQPARIALAMLGCVGAATLVYAVGRTSPLRLVLAGTALGSVLMGLSLGLRLVSPEVFDDYRFWSVGALAGTEQSPLGLPLAVIGVALVGGLLLSRPLSALALGEETGRSLGVNVAATRVATLVVVTMLAGTATAVAGPIAFAGLIVPHLARAIAGTSIPWLVGCAAVLGPVVLVVADIGSRLLLPTGEVPVAIVLAFVGCPTLIWAVRRYGAAAL